MNARTPSCVSALPKNARRVFLSLYDEVDGIEVSPLLDLITRVCCDLEMEPVWKSIVTQLPDSSDGADALMILYGSALRLLSEPAFSAMTDPERLSWLESTRGACLRLQDLLERGPALHAENVISAIPLDKMKSFLATFGVHVRPNASVQGDYEDGKFFISEWSLKRAQNGRHPLSMSELLTTVLDELAPGVPSTQTVRKPRDVKAGRASYILRVTEQLHHFGVHLTDELVASTARVVLQDSTITAGLANRFRYRPNLDVLLGAELQDSGHDAENVG